MRLKDAVDKHDRIILYVWLRNMKKGHPLKTMMSWYMFETDLMVHVEPLSRLRNGTVRATVPAFVNRSLIILHHFPMSLGVVHGFSWSVGAEEP